MSLFSWLRSGRLTPASSPADVAALLLDIAAARRRSFDEVGVLFQVDVGTGRASADVEVVRRLVEGLVDFAVRNARAGSRVTLTGWPTRRAYLVQVLIEAPGPSARTAATALAGDRDADPELAELASAAASQGGELRVISETPYLGLEVSLPPARDRPKTPRPRGG